MCIALHVHHPKSNFILLPYTREKREREEVDKGKRTLKITEYKAT